jgi:hypothetical protein
MQASAKVTVQPSGSIRLSDVQALLLWALADGVSPKWAFIEARCVPFTPLKAQYTPSISQSVLQH